MGEDSVHHSTLIVLMTGIFVLPVDPFFFDWGRPYRDVGH